MEYIVLIRLYKVALIVYMTMSRVQDLVMRWETSAHQRYGLGRATQNMVQSE